MAKTKTKTTAAEEGSLPVLEKLDGTEVRVNDESVVIVSSPSSNHSSTVEHDAVASSEKSAGNDEKGDGDSNIEASKPQPSSEDVTSRGRLIKPAVEKKFTPCIGMRFQREFRDGNYYEGTVMSGPNRVDDDGNIDEVWHVKYVDGDKEDLSTEELEQCIILDDPASRKRAAEKKLTPSLGLRLRKRFNDGQYYAGVIVSGPELVENDRGEMNEEWHVVYDDGDEEDLTPEELQACEVVGASPKKKARVQISKYDKAKEALCALPTMTEEEVVEALEKVGPPYGMQAVTDAVHQARDAKNYADPSSGLFRPEIGLRIRKMFGGRNWYGTVTRDAELVEEPSENEGEPPREVMMWQVTYDNDGDVDDMTWQELFQHRADRPIRAAPCRGRVLQSLELFSGCGIITQEFVAKNWAVCSIDNSPLSNATVKKSILDIQPSDLEFVPDFIWASPPCHTYSNMAGGKHRNATKGKFEITEDARYHNFLFVHMAKIMEWAKKLHPHLIVVIENPVGQMAKMPLMKEVEKSLGLYLTHVHYCTLGRDDKKPTCLWTNDFGLHARLSDFKCSARRCPYYKSGCHPMSCRQHGSRFNAAAIPNALAEEVAHYVDSKFYMDRVAYTKAALPPSWKESGKRSCWRDAGLLDRIAAGDQVGEMAREGEIVAETNANEGDVVDKEGNHAEAADQDAKMAEAGEQAK